MGVDHEVTLAANRAAFAHFRMRPKRLVDVRKLDTSLELLGAKLTSPLLLAPIGSQAAYHSEAELGVARAAASEDHLQMVSMGASSPLAEIADARSGPLWAQVYGQRFQPVTRHFLREAEAAGCGAIVLTVDIVGLPTGRERIERYRRHENLACTPCHASIGGTLGRGAMRVARAVGLDPLALAARSMMLDWGIVDRIRDATSLPLVIKGILTGEDAERCLEHGVDAIIVSNHGGRAEDNGFASIDALPEVAQAVAGRIPILIDSGFRRGTDVFKALALGASAVCIGRPYIWGLASFGEAGVARVLAILRSELEAVMRQMGTPNLAAIDESRVDRAPAQ
jgi:4-hydroxymandelate oxidase